MNRLSPLIVRRTGPTAAAAAATRQDFFVVRFDQMTAPAWLEDARLFATGLVGGLIFFSTYLG